MIGIKLGSFLPLYELGELVPLIVFATVALLGCESSLLPTETLIFKSWNYSLFCVVRIDLLYSAALFFGILVSGSTYLSAGIVGSS